MRNLVDVCSQIIEEVPDTFEQKPYLVDHLQEVCESYIYTAPEAIPGRWGQVSYILDKFLGEPDADWKKNIVKIFGDQENAN